MGRIGLESERLFLKTFIRRWTPINADGGRISRRCEDDGATTYGVVVASKKLKTPSSGGGVEPAAVAPLIENASSSGASIQPRRNTHPPSAFIGVHLRIVLKNAPLN